MREMNNKRTIVYLIAALISTGLIAFAIRDKSYAMTIDGSNNTNESYKNIVDQVVTDSSNYDFSSNTNGSLIRFSINNVLDEEGSCIGRNGTSMYEGGYFESGTILSSALKEGYRLKVAGVEHTTDEYDESKYNSTIITKIPSDNIVHLYTVYLVDEAVSIKYYHGDVFLGETQYTSVFKTPTAEELSQKTTYNLGGTLKSWQFGSQEVTPGDKPSQMGHEDVTLTANVNGYNWTLTIDKQGGTFVTEPPTEFVGAAEIDFNDYVLKKNGFVFKGYSTDLIGSEGTKINYLNYKPKKQNDSVTLTANWENGFYFKIDANGGHLKGSGQTSEIWSVSKTQTTTLDSNLVQDGMYLKGYAFDSNATTPSFNINAPIIYESYEEEYADDTNTITLYAIWGEGSYHIDIDANGGNIEGDESKTVDSHTVELDQSISLDTKVNYNGKNHVGYSLNRNASPSDNGNYHYGQTISYEQLIQDGAVGSDGTITLYAIWRDPSPYKVYYEGNGGSFNDGLTTRTSLNGDYYIGETYYTSTNPFSIPGGTFKYWATNADGTGTTYNGGETLTFTPTEENPSITLYAVWELPYSVVYKGNGGKTADGSTSYNGTDIYHVESNKFAKTGYIFGGWTDGSSPSLTTGAPISFTPSEGNTTYTLTATWVGPYYESNLHANGGKFASYGDREEVLKKTVVESNVFDAPVRDGYKFLGYALSSDATTPLFDTSHTNLTGDDVTTLSLQPGSKTDYYAVWDGPYYTIELNAGTNGKFSDNSQTKSVECKVGDEVFSDTPTRSGYEFAGYAKGDDFSIDTSHKNLTAADVTALSLSPGGTVTLNASWNAIKYVKLNLNGGDFTGGSSTEIYKVSEIGSFNNYSVRRDKYELLGWSMSPLSNTATWTYLSSTALSGVSTTDTTEDGWQYFNVYAIWDGPYINVSLNANGGTFGDSDGDFKSLDNVKDGSAVFSNIPEKTGYKFLGYSSRPSATTPLFDTSHTTFTTTSDASAAGYSANSSSFAFYAVWDGPYYQIGLDAGDNASFSSGVRTLAVEGKVGDEIFANVPTKEGYTFAGYSVALAGGGSFSIDASHKALTAEDVTTLGLTAGVRKDIGAIWTPIKYAKLNSNGGLYTDNSTSKLFKVSEISNFTTSLFKTDLTRSFLGWGIAYNDKTPTYTNLTPDLLSGLETTSTTESGLNYFDLFAVWKDLTSPGSLGPGLAHSLSSGVKYHFSGGRFKVSTDPYIYEDVDFYVDGGTFTFTAQ